MDQDIGVGHQPGNDPLPLRALQVYARSFGSRHNLHRYHVHRHASPPVPFRRFDPNDPRPQLCQEGTRHGASEEHGQVQHGNPLQRIVGQRHAAIGSLSLRPVEAAEHLLRVLARIRSWCCDATRGLGQRGQRPELAHPAHPGVLHILEVAVVDDLGMMHPLLNAQERLRRHIGGFLNEDVHPLFQRLLLEALQHDLPQGLSILLGEDRRLPEAGVFQHMTQSHGMELRNEVALHHVAHLDPLAILGAGRQVAQRRIASHPGVLHKPLRELHHHLPEDPVDVVVEGNRLEEAGF